MDVSVIIPAHNEEKYIGKCLQSIRKAEKHITSRVQQSGRLRTTDGSRIAFEG